jgi:AbrB family looped-hinge helix DNA binding protein
MKRVVKQLRHGQITIPKDLRDAAGIEPEDMLSIDMVEGKLQVEPVKVTSKHKGSPWLKDLYDLYSPVRKSLENVPEHEINEAIEEAVREVRAGE